VPGTRQKVHRFAREQLKTLERVLRRPDLEQKAPALDRNRLLFHLVVLLERSTATKGNGLR